MKFYIYTWFNILRLLGPLFFCFAIDTRTFLAFLAFAKIFESLFIYWFKEKTHDDESSMQINLLAILVTYSDLSA